ncbi:MAG TPA: hypothetical protein VE377_01535 [Candidatus Dormibacteraeota bacterium]|nr:hypothetical protein [Candidatus Dormibacteraeota bacterium]
MRRVVCSLVVVVLCIAGAVAQQTATPQNARQALLEMFFSKTPGTFAKHLPAATRAALEKSGAMTSLQQYSLLIGQLQSQGQNVQTFETGSILLTSEDPKTGQKAEITVENDALRGDQDDIEVAFHAYKDGKTQMSPFMPQITFSMKQEAQVWTLNEISITIHLPLADAEFLKAITEKMKPQPGLQAQTSATGTFVPRPEIQVSSAGNDAAVLASMRTILTAEVTYAVTYPRTGFTCMLSDLDGFGGGEPNEHQAMLINSGLASGKRHGFVFALSGCSTAPATSFRLSAAPGANSVGRKAFCADQSAVIRWSDDGNPATCFASGTPVQ